MIAGSIIVAGAVGLNQLRLLTAGWALYTLFSRVGEIDLLALQLAAIALACVAGERLNRLTHAFGRGFAPDKIRIELYKIDRVRRIGFTEAAFILAVAVAFAWLAAAPGADQPPVALSSRGPGPPGPIGGVPHQRGTGGGPVAGSTGAAAAHPLPTTPDMRHCLARGSAEAIVSCAESNQ